MATLLHELWIVSDQEQTFCLGGPMGAEVRAMMGPGARLVWTVEATSHFDAMTKYYAHMNWGTYSTDHAWDREAYPEEWARIQRGAS